jgi:hypothetical protein
MFMERRPIYCFTDDRSGIIIQHDWLEYLERNAVIIRGWARFQLAKYLQSKNPNVPGIIEKLTAPLTRASISAQTTWWRTAIPLLGTRAACIYSAIRLEPNNFSLDHYLPWSFVAHDRLWNLIPIPRGINSAKADRIPSDRYLDSLINLQHAALIEMRNALPE